jgi:hypothetical protein
MALKSLIAGGLLALGLGLGLTAAPAEAKTRVHIGIGVGSPFYDYRCENPGFIDFCGAGFYHRPYYRPYYRPYNYDPYYDPYYPRLRHRRVVRRSTCDSAALAIREAGYRNIRAVDCAGRFYSYRATKRGRSYSLRVDTRSGRISVRR